jgi:hypothetical protein
VTIVAGVGVNDETNGQFVEMVITSTGSGSANTFNEVRVTHTAVTTGFTSTDWVSAFYELEFISDASGILASWQATLGQGSTITVRGMGQVRADYNTEPQPFPTGQRFWVQTEPLLIESRTSLSPILRLNTRVDVAGTATLRARRALLRIVSDPSTDAPWVP